MSDEIVLRPVTADDLDLFEREFNRPEGTGEFQWFGFGSPAGLRRRFAETGLLSPDGGVLSVAEAGRTVGRVEWFMRHLGAARHLHLLEPGDRPGARRARPRHRHPGPATAGPVPLRPHQGRAAPGLDGLREPRRATCVGESRLREGGRAALRTVARRPVARSSDLLHAPRGAARQRTKPVIARTRLHRPPRWAPPQPTPMTARPFRRWCKASRRSERKPDHIPVKANVPGL